MGNKHSKLSPEQLNELQRITYFDKKEILQWYKGFLKDAPNGVLDRSEFQKIYKQFFPFGDPSGFANLAFNMFDRDGDGVVSFHEFIVALSITTRGKLDEKLECTGAFKLYDLDGDGQISHDEMLQVVSSMYQMTSSMITFSTDEDTAEKRVEKIFETMDANKDGKLSLEEFKEGAKTDPLLLQCLSVYVYEGMIKGNNDFSQLASLDNEEELSKTWKICTKVKDSIENGVRLENLSWRLWHLHKLILDENSRKRISRRTTTKLFPHNLQEQCTQIVEGEQPKVANTTENDVEMPKSLDLSTSNDLSLSINCKESNLFVADDFFAGLGATVLLGDVDHGPQLEIPLDAFNLDLTNLDLFPDLNATLPHQDLLQSADLANFEDPSQVDLSCFPPISLSVTLSKPPLQSTDHIPTASLHSESSLLTLGTMQQCGNCLTQTTPLWRKCDDDGSILCNACGLYYKLHKKHRPRSLKNFNQKKLFENTPAPTCANCGTSTTPLWRRDEEGLTLCNACGLYRKMHNSHRPLSLKTDVIKKRQRHDPVRRNSQHNSAKRQRKSLNDSFNSTDESLIASEFMHDLPMNNGRPMFGLF